MFLPPYCTQVGANNNCGGTVNSCVGALSITAGQVLYFSVDGFDADFGDFSLRLQFSAT